ncbi:6727_t:CDS:2 [Ambispora gerdemannii]|uniref:6727_t:CDS:1 n=1 Tax=Ambispora gerdemannii TaxID=144530 RepID=A0A9N8UVT8_9GLOM|nr:6727_t:CDS:2 [Ambispora gerdemannii]
MRVTSPINSTKISFTHQVTASFAIKLTIALIKHLLFMRGQIPCLFSQVEKLSQRTSVVRSDLSNAQQKKIFERKISDLLTNSQNLFTSIGTTVNHILDKNDDQKFLPVLNFTIILGNTATSPKEIYLLKFANVYADHALELNENTREKLKQHELASERKLARELVTVLNDEPLAPTRLHLLFRTSRNNPPPELIPKQRFKLKNTNKIPTFIIACEGLLNNNLKSKIKHTNIVPNANNDMPNNNKKLSYEDMIKNFNEEIVPKEKDALDKSQGTIMCGGTTDHVEDLQNSRHRLHHYDDTIIHNEIIAKEIKSTDSAHHNNKSLTQEVEVSASIKNSESIKREYSDEFTIDDDRDSKSEKQDELKRGDLTALKKIYSEELPFTLTKEIHDDNLIWYRCKNILIGFPAA